MAAETGILFFILILTSANLLLIAYISSGKRTILGSFPFSVLMIAMSLWSFLYAVGFDFTNNTSMLLFNILPFFVVVFIPVLWIWFVLDYTGKKEYVKCRYFIPLLIIPVLTIIIIVTNGLHGFFVSVEYYINSGGMLISFMYGPWYYVHTFYCYSLFIFGFLILLRAYFLSPRYHKTQISYVIFGALMPCIGNILFISGIFPDIYFDLTPLFFLLTGIIVYFGVFRVPLAEFVPSAYDKVFSSMIEGVIVADRNGMIIDINPSAEKLTGIKSRDAGGMYVSVLLPSLSSYNISELNTANFKEITEMKISGRNSFVLLQSAPLEPGEFSSGFILLLRDITSEYENRQRERDSVVQIEENLEQLAILNDRIRNPLSVIVGVSSSEDTPANKEILEQAEKINSIIGELDNHYLKSDKVRAVLKRHYNMEFDD